MRVIVAVDRNWAIGKDGKLLNSIPDDQRFFRQTTTNQVVIMGRKTLESLPGGKPLPNRTNVILTRNEDFQDPDVLVAHSVQEALDLAQEKGADIYIAGGSEIYEQMLNYCDEAYVTFIDYAYQADTYFPNLDKMAEWVMVAESEEQTHFDIVYYYRQYVRRKDFRE
ncbi:MAG: dihydrofolate reductase [Lachnospiraceae bacterium]|nr:dihydrofolate reductase [Lachnospiraceae bacterium]